MKQNVFKFVVAIVLVAIAVVVNNIETNSEVQTAGGGLSLKQANDTTKTNVVAFAQGNATTDGEYLGQITVITNWEHQYGNGIFVGADLIGTASTQFGVMAPTVDARCGLDFNTCRLELKAGNFTRNSVTTVGFGPQFGNNCILWGEPAAVSNAVQMSLIAKNTKVYFGHQGGEKFYSFCDGNYYVGAEQKIKNISLSGGVNFTEKMTGYAAAKWSAKNNTVTFTANKLGSEDQNFVASYVRSNIPLGKGVRMSVGGTYWHQPEKFGWLVVTGLSKGKFTLFTEAGSLFGGGFNYNL